MSYENEDGEIVVNYNDYPDNENYAKFCEDAWEAGFQPTEYHGRWFYVGPAVIVDDISDMMSKTTVPCTHDGMGKGYVVYPK